LKPEYFGFAEAIYYKIISITGFDIGYKSAISNLPIYFRFHPSIQFDEYPGTQERAIFCYKFVTDKKI
jgi:hypothetical protein